jgi:hypothetical protein
VKKFRFFWVARRKAPGEIFFQNYDFGAYCNASGSIPLIGREPEMGILQDT